jgi:hypothetical protein
MDLTEDTVSVAVYWPLIGCLFCSRCLAPGIHAAIFCGNGEILIVNMLFNIRVSSVNILYPNHITNSILKKFNNSGRVCISWMITGLKITDKNWKTGSRKCRIDWVHHLELQVSFESRVKYFLTELKAEERQKSRIRQVRRKCVSSPGMATRNLKP